MNGTTRRRVRLSLWLTLSGLVAQLLTLLHWTPLTFILSAVFGLGAVMVGSVIFLWTVWRTIEPAASDMRQSQEKT